MREVLLICCLVLSACGGTDPEPEAQQESAPKRKETRLVVEVRPTRDDPAKRRVVMKLPAGVTAADFAPVPADTACAEIYGGPASARVDGVLDGKPLHATFNRTNACEMERWDRVSELLGSAPGDGPRLTP